MGPLEVAPIVLASVTLFVGLAFLALFARRGRRIDLTLGLTCIGLGAYDVLCAGLYQAPSPVEGVRWQRAQLVSLALAGIPFCLFAYDYTGRVSRKWLAGSILFFAVMAIAGLVDRSDLTWRTGRALVKHVEPWPGVGITYQETEAGPLITLEGIGSVLIFGYLLWAAVRSRAANRKKANLLIVALVLFGFAVTNDIFVNAGVYRFFYFMEYAWTGLVLLMTYSLTSEIVDASIAKKEHAVLEARLEQAERMEALGRLAAGIAHDFNNQLTPITGYAEMGLRGKKPAEVHERYFGQIREAADHARELSGQLLALGRKRVLDLRTVKLNEIVTESESLIRRAIGEGIDLRFRLDPAAGNIKADATQVRQILMNLVLNARDAMPKGGTISIETCGATLDAASLAESPGSGPGQHAMLAVGDTGIGMDPETVKRIFEPFFTTKEPDKGTGLGLATVNGLVRQHGGVIRVQSEPDQGTTFRVYLPSVPEAAAEASLAGPEPVEAGGIETILLVENRDTIRAMVHEALGRLGYTVLEAETAGRAIALTEKHQGRIDLLLTTVIMPGMNGRELHERLRERRPGLRVLYMSAYEEEGIAHSARMSEGAPFLPKPFSLRTLAMKVRAAIDRPAKPEPSTLSAGP